MRPRFELATELSVEELTTRFRAHLAATDRPVAGLVFRKHVELTSPPERKHLWSPHLGLSLEAREGGGTRVCGRFSPAPSVWTGFMAIHGVLGMLGIGGTMYGLAEWGLGRTPWTLLSPLVAAALIAFVAGAAFVGQGLGSEEMYELRRFVDACLAGASDPSSGEGLVRPDPGALQVAHHDPVKEALESPQGLGILSEADALQQGAGEDRGADDRDGR